MGKTPIEYLDDVMTSFTAAFLDVTVVTRDNRPERCMLEMWGKFGSYRVKLLEVVTASLRRKYAYYVLKDNRVIVGFDNAPDIHALRLKYGSDYKFHRRERIPHRHTLDKAKVELTDEMTCNDVIAWIQNNLALE